VERVSVRPALFTFDIFGTVVDWRRGLALDLAAAGHELGHWPRFADAEPGLRALLTVAPCVAMTNSDREHGVVVQRGLGFELSAWICAEDVGVYKPSRRFWHEVSRRRGIPFGTAWWHVSAYADYDLEVARELGLSTVFVQRPHCRPGPADHTVRDLLELAALVAAAARARDRATP